MAAQPSRNIAPARVLDFGRTNVSNWSYATLIVPQAAIRADGRIFFSDAEVLDATQAFVQLLGDKRPVKNSPWGAIEDGRHIYDISKTDLFPTAVKIAKRGDEYTAIDATGDEILLDSNDVETLLSVRQSLPATAYRRDIGTNVDSSVHKYWVDNVTPSKIATDEFGQNLDMGRAHVRSGSGSGPRSFAPLGIGLDLNPISIG